MSGTLVTFKLKNASSFGLEKISDFDPIKGYPNAREHYVWYTTA